MVTQLPDMNGEVMNVVQTSAHRFLVNTSGVLLYAATEDAEAGDLTRSEAVELGFEEILALVDHVNQRRGEYVAALARLRQTWRTVADEVIGRFEEQEAGSATRVGGSEVQRLLQTLGPVTFHGYGRARSFAGQWYQSLWTPDGYAAMFGQQWVPFLLTLRQRIRERFPERFAGEGADEE